MSDKRQKNQLELAFVGGGRSETPRLASGGTESLMAERGTESPAKTDRLMEGILDPENLRKALKQVKANKGSAGVDRMTVDQMPDYLKQHWPVIREQLLEGTYKPRPVLRVEIPKPDGGVRKLGIPVVMEAGESSVSLDLLVRTLLALGASSDNLPRLISPRADSYTKNSIQNSE